MLIRDSNMVLLQSFSYHHIINKSSNSQSYCYMDSVACVVGPSVNSHYKIGETQHVNIVLQCVY
jgi:hypothetical protein